MLKFFSDSFDIHYISIIFDELVYAIRIDNIQFRPQNNNQKYLSFFNQETLNLILKNRKSISLK